MGDEWKKDLEESNRAFIDCVWPIIKDVCGGGGIKPVEMIEDNSLAKDMDLKCGIDIWQTIDGKGCRGIASRVQWGKNWGTFTVRKRRFSGAKTEYEKRKEAIKNGSYVYPYLTCQAYIEKETFSLHGGAVARTSDIFKTIERGLYKTRQTTNASFFAVDFEDVENAQEFNATGMK